MKTTANKLVSWRCLGCLSFGSSVDGNAARVDAEQHAKDFDHKVTCSGFRVTDRTNMAAEKGYGRKDGTPFATIEEAEAFAKNLRAMPGFGACIVSVVEVGV